MVEDRLVYTSPTLATIEDKMKNQDANAPCQDIFVEVVRKFEMRVYTAGGKIGVAG